MAILTNAGLEKNFAAAGQTIRETAASKVAGYAERLGEKAETLAVRAADRLYSISRPEQQSPSGETKGEELPPLFYSMNNSLDRINQALDSIDDLLSRVEV